MKIEKENGQQWMNKHKVLGNKLMFDLELFFSETCKKFEEQTVLKVWKIGGNEFKIWG